MKLHTLLAQGGFGALVSLDDPEISGICTDSRQIKPGDLFVCIPGQTADGSLFAVEAQRKGAAAVIGQQTGIPGLTVPFVPVPDARKALAALSAAFYGFPSRDLKIFGVTGTNGKTTVSWMIRSICRAAGKACGLLGTIAYDLGGEEIAASRTTPEAHELQKIFAEMRDRKIRFCAMEASSHGLELGRTDHTEFRVGIFTNLTRDHLDFHKTFDDYYQAKKKLFCRSVRACVINMDDPAGRRLSAELRSEGMAVITYGSFGADYMGQILRMNDRGSDILLHRRDHEPEAVYVPLPGKHNVQNALAAAAACLSEGFSIDAVRKGLAEMDAVPGRFERIDGPCGQRIIVDYAHTPDALGRVLETAKAFTKGRLICLFGCGGERDKEKRPLMGLEAGKWSDFCILTDDNPRREPSLEILRQIEKGILKTRCDFEVIPDRRKAIARALKLWKAEDTILIAGRGHEPKQSIGTSEISFDDRQVVRELLHRT